MGDTSSPRTRNTVLEAYVDRILSLFIYSMLLLDVVYPCEVTDQLLLFLNLTAALSMVTTAGWTLAKGLSLIPPILL